jgi:enoyl-CoA hydratase/carnithine racemase
LLEAAFTLAKKIAAKSQIAASFTKRAVKQSLEIGESAAIEHERSLFIGIMNSKDKQEGIDAFVGKRKAVFKDE